MGNNHHIRIVIILIGLFFITACKHDHNHDGHNHDGHDHGTATVDETKKENQNIKKDEHEGHDHDGESHEGHNHEGHEGHNHGATAQENEDHNEDIHFTKEQAAIVKLALGYFKQAKTTGYVEANGTLGLPPNSYASVNAKTEGIIVNSSKIVEGNKVKKGQIIAYLENPLIIQKQQEYLEARAQLKFLKNEFKRQQELFDAKAGALSHLQKAKAEYEMYASKTAGLKQYLNFLGVNTSRLTTANIQSKVPVIVPMDGYVTKVNYHNGLTVSTNQEIIEVVNDDQLHLELQVFENDVKKIRKEQRISFTIPALGNSIFEGEITGIGKEFSSSAKTIRVHGHVTGYKKPQFIKDLYLQAKIWLNDETGTVLPENAVVRVGGQNYIYVTKNNLNDNEIQFRKVLVKTGNIQNGTVAVTPIDSIASNERIVTNGAYYVYAKSISGELEHSHSH